MPAARRRRRVRETIRHVTRRQLLGIGAIGSVASWAGESWRPFRPIEDSTFRVVADPAAFATLNREFTWTLEWRPTQSFLPGTQLEMRSLNLRTYFSWKYSRIEIDHADMLFRRRRDLQASDLFPLKGRWIIARFRLQYELPSDEPLRIQLAARPPYVAGLYDAITIWAAAPVVGSQPDAGERDFRPVPRAQAVLRVGPAVAERLAVYSHPMPDSDGHVPTVIVPEDRYGNPSEFRGPVAVELEWDGKKWTEVVKERKALSLPAPQDIARLAVSVPANALAVSENVANGQRKGGRLVVTGNPVWAEAPGGLRAGFGEFHWHSEISADGARGFSEALASARDHLNMDWVAPGEHRPRAEQWRYMVSTLEEFNKPGKFATFFGYEHGGNRGHENYYFTNPDHPVSSPRGLVKSPDLAALASELTPYNTPENRFIAVPHHTNTESETRRLSDDAPYWFPYNWTEPASYHRAVEIFQARGNQERDDYPDDTWRGWHANRASAQDALAHGYKLGFTGGTDNHCGLPGRAFAAEEDYGRIPTYSVALTGVWTERIERDKVFNAIYRRHTWAVWDTRALVYFSVNGGMAGEEIEVPREAELTARIKMSAEDALRSIEIVSEKRIVWSGASDELDLDLRAPLGPCRRATHFYLRAMQRNGGIIYASPVFVKTRD